jgi:hypothetical protein
MQPFFKYPRDPVKLSSFKAENPRAVIFSASQFSSDLHAMEIVVCWPRILPAIPTWERKSLLPEH